MSIVYNGSGVSAVNFNGASMCSVIQLPQYNEGSRCCARFAWMNPGAYFCLHANDFIQVTNADVERNGGCLRFRVTFCGGDNDEMMYVCNTGVCPAGHLISSTSSRVYSGYMGMRSTGGVKVTFYNQSCGSCLTLPICVPTMQRSSYYYWYVDGACIRTCKWWADNGYCSTTGYSDWCYVGFDYAQCMYYGYCCVTCIDCYSSGYHVKYAPEYGSISYERATGFAHNCRTTYSCYVNVGITTLPNVGPYYIGG